MWWIRHSAVIGLTWFEIALLPAELAAGGRATGEFPLAGIIADVRRSLTATRVTPTGMTRADYLATAEGVVSYFRHFQAPDGRILDPFARREVQYSTPCYAWAAAALVDSGRRPDLVESAASALTAALLELADGKPADGHGDFFTFPVMLAYESLRGHVAPARRKRWEELLRAVRPERAYRDLLTAKKTAVHNWNVVAIAGEFMRGQDGFTDNSFVERYLGAQEPYFTPAGMYRDPNVPMAYDQFPRHFLAAMLARGYHGGHRAWLEETLERAAWTSLLIQSPVGELPTGGRSAQHQWNEAMQCVTCEIWSARKSRAGDATAAAAFKRAAHLALRSVRRWIRPSGELWIVKNRFDPAVRHGFESYSFHSQYNLLAASMLATAWLFADDTTAEGPAPADVGGYVIQLPEFHKVIANAGGLYAEIDTGADPHYNSTGLIRVHRAGVEPLIGPTDGAAIKDLPLAIGIAWREGDRWQPLAGLGQPRPPPTKVTLQSAAPVLVRFSIRYATECPAAADVIENYALTPHQLHVAVAVEGATDRLQVRFPALAFDGERATRITTEGAVATVEL
ncbi:MAG: hypothetical protein KGS61_13365, partial [Verrucomicrobia bacterium]|nr:hypothetical protein [Verrucomicrobiota bacterium]